MRTSAVILAGGKSRRLGRDKSLLELGGKPVIVRVLERLKQLSSDIVVVTAADHPLPHVGEIEGVRVVVDVFPGKGALGGLYTGLEVATHHHSIVVACDMPFLNVELLKYMVQSCQWYDIVIPRFEGYFEPLHAIYSKACLPVIGETLQSGELKILSFFPLVRVRYLEEVEIDRYDPRRLSFLNINTEDDVRKAMDEVKRGN